MLVVITVLVVVGTIGLLGVIMHFVRKANPEKKDSLFDYVDNIEDYNNVETYKDITAKKK